MHTLSEFARSHGIEYDLLSDEASTMITELGLLNAHVEEQNAFYGIELRDHHRGLPYPGTFLLDREGIVVQKHFEQSYRDRPSGSRLLATIGGSSRPASYEATVADVGVVLRVRSDRRTYRPMQTSSLEVELDIHEGHHVYTEPLSEGYRALSIGIEQAEGVDSWQPEIPTGRPFVMDGLDDEFHVLEGNVKMELPFKISGSGHLLDGRSRPEPVDMGLVVLTVVAMYQVCSDVDCYPPARAYLSVPLTEEGLVR